MQRIFISILVCFFSLCIGAENNAVKQLLIDVTAMGGKPVVLEEEGSYARIQLTESATIELYESDTMVVVMTVCAPQCSSCARVYSKENQLLYTITPTVASIFPIATIDKKTGMVIWDDNDNWEY